MKTISNHQAQTELLKGSAVIIDVREPSEFREKHIPGAINLPSTRFNSTHFSGFTDLNIHLICESGNRANQIRSKLAAEGFHNLYIMETQMQYIDNFQNTSGWTVDRQFRLTLGVLIALFLVLYAWGQKLGLIIPIILASGLIFTSIIDRCYMRMGIAMLPWNRGKKV